jgi:Leucine-rich repeat (LRR) protein
MNWSEYNQKTKIIDLSYNKLTSFSFKGAPKGLEKINLIGNQLTSFNWEGAPKRLKEV